MGKKGVILDSGKTAQSSMALYWNAGKKRKNDQERPKVQAKEENIEERA